MNTAPRLHAGRPAATAHVRRPIPASRSLAGAAGALQRSAGNRAMAGLVAQRKDAPAPAPVDEAGIRAGVAAFDAVAGFEPPIKGPVPALAGGVPASLRTALEHVRSAKDLHFEASGLSPEDTVLKRLSAQGPGGLLTLLSDGPYLIGLERISRNDRAASEWRTARPAIENLATALATFDQAGAERMRDTMRFLDGEMTERGARLLAELAASSTPAQVEMAKAVSETKEEIDLLEKVVNTTGTASKAAEAITGSGAFSDKHEHLGHGLTTKKGKVPEAGGGNAADSKPGDFDVSEGSVSAGMEKGVALLGKAKKLLSVYESGKGLAEAAEILDAEDKGLTAKSKAVIDIGTAVLTPLQEAAPLILKGSAAAMDLAVRKMVKYGVAGAGKLAKSAEGLRHMAESLEGLEKVTGVLGVLSGALGVVEAWRDDDAAGVIGGTLDTVVGTAGLVAEEAGTKAGLAMAGVGVLEVKVLLQVADDLSKALAAIRNQDIHHAVDGIADDLDEAGQHAAAYSAVQDEIGLNLAQDAVSQRAVVALEAQSTSRIDQMRRAVGSALLAAKDGNLREMPMLQDTFCTAFGGRSGAVAVGMSLRQGGGTHADGEFLIDQLPRLRWGVGDLLTSIEGLDRAAKGGKIAFTQTDRNRVSMIVDASIDEGGALLVDVPKDGVHLESPIEDEQYLTWMRREVADVPVRQLHSAAIRLNVDLAGTTVVLEGMDGELHRSEGWTSSAISACGPWTGYAGTEEASKVALWSKLVAFLEVPKDFGAV